MPDSFEDSFGDGVKLARKEQRLTQQALAALAGVRVELVQLLEAGGFSFVSEESIERITGALGLISPAVWYSLEERH